jgi:hypothetical protein
LYLKKCTKKFRLNKFMEKVAEWLVLSNWGEKQHKCSAGRLVGRNHFAHRIPTMDTKEKGKCQHTCKVCADRRKCYTGNPHGSTPPSTAGSVTMQASVSRNVLIFNTQI